MEEIVGLSAKERARLVELEQVKAGRQTVVAEDVFVFEEERTVQNDWTVAWDNRWFQITGPKCHLPRRRERIVVRRRLDGSRALLHRGRDLEFHEIQQRPSRTPQIKTAALPVSRPAWVPADDHPWKTPLTTASALTSPRFPYFHRATTTTKRGHF
jgi:hypothetical protein